MPSWQLPVESALGTLLDTMPAALHRTAASGWSSNWCGDRSGWADGSTLISQLFSILPNVFVIVEQAFLVINKSDPPNKKLPSVPMPSLASL